MDRGRKAELYGNATTWTREISKNLVNHFTRISIAQHRVNTAPIKPNLSHSSISKRTQLKQDRLEAIECENRRLLDKIASIALSTNVHTSHPSPQNKTNLNHSNHSSLNSKSMIQKENQLNNNNVKHIKVKSLHEGIRKRQQEKIWKENQALLKRLQQSKSTIKSNEWKKDDERNRYYIQSMERRRKILQGEQVHITVPTNIEGSNENDITILEELSALKEKYSPKKYKKKVHITQSKNPTLQKRTIQFKSNKIVVENNLSFNDNNNNHENNNKLHEDKSILNHSYNEDQPLDSYHVISNDNMTESNEKNIIFEQADEKRPITRSSGSGERKKYLNDKDTNQEDKFLSDYNGKMKDDSMKKEIKKEEKSRENEKEKPISDNSYSLNNNVLKQENNKMDMNNADENNMKNVKENISELKSSYETTIDSKKDKHYDNDMSKMKGLDTIKNNSESKTIDNDKLKDAILVPIMKSQEIYNQKNDFKESFSKTEENNIHILKKSNVEEELNDIDKKDKCKEDEHAPFKMEIPPHDLDKLLSDESNYSATYDEEQFMEDRFINKKIQDNDMTIKLRSEDGSIKIHNTLEDNETKSIRSARILNSAGYEDDFMDEINSIKSENVVEQNLDVHLNKEQNLTSHSITNLNIKYSSQEVFKNESEVTIHDTTDTISSINTSDSYYKNDSLKLKDTYDNEQKDTNTSVKEPSQMTYIYEKNKDIYLKDTKITETPISSDIITNKLNTLDNLESNLIYPSDEKYFGNTEEKLDTKDHNTHNNNEYHDDCTYLDEYYDNETDMEENNNDNTMKSNIELLDPSSSYNKNYIDNDNENQNQLSNVNLSKQYDSIQPDVIQTMDQKSFSFLEETSTSLVLTIPSLERNEPKISINENDIMDHLNEKNKIDELYYLDDACYDEESLTSRTNEQKCTKEEFIIKNDLNTEIKNLVDESIPYRSETNENNININEDSMIHLKENINRSKLIDVTTDLYTNENNSQIVDIEENSIIDHYNDEFDDDFVSDTNNNDVTIDS